MSKRVKLAWASVVILTLVGIALLGEVGLVGVLVLLIALAIATRMVVRTPAPTQEEGGS
jgi:hypothetical protein